MTTETIERSVKGPADLEALFPGRFLSVTSFKRDGTGVATPLWFVSDGARLFAFTDRHSPKVRRIRRNPNVLIAPCRANGSLRGQPVSAHAEVLTAEPELERVKTLLLARYAISYRVVMLCYRLGRRLRGRQAVAEGAALAITLDSAPSAVGAPTGR
jgi:PPOX class probable F420-dependent enzyme